MLMRDLVFLTKREEEYLLRTLESGLHVSDLRQFFLWVRGQFQGFLPHAVMICIHFDEMDQVSRLECLHNNTFDPAQIKRLTHTADGLAVRMVKYCRGLQKYPFSFQCGASDTPQHQRLLEAEVSALKFSNALLHGTPKLSGGATFFVLFGMPEQLSERKMFFIELLLPQLHLAFMRVILSRSSAMAPVDGALLNPLSEREAQILKWVTLGKSNNEVADILSLSPFTIKNHMQNIYKKLDVNNRVQAVAKSRFIRLPNVEG